MAACLVDDGDFPIIQGNNHPPAKWQFLVSESPEVLFDLTGSIFKLTVSWAGGEIEKSSDVDPELTIDLPTSIVTWAYTVEESRMLPIGRITHYELERWIDGSQQTLVRAAISVSSGDNPD